MFGDSNLIIFDLLGGGGGGGFEPWMALVEWHLPVIFDILDLLVF